MKELCKHDWVGDDNCPYCENDTLKARIIELEADAEAFKTANGNLSTTCRSLLRATAEPPAVESFVVKHYSVDERPTIKGNGFDGLEVGHDRQEAEEFVSWINIRLSPEAQARAKELLAAIDARRTGSAPPPSASPWKTFAQEIPKQGKYIWWSPDGYKAALSRAADFCEKDKGVWCYAVEPPGRPDPTKGGEHG